MNYNWNFIKSLPGFIEHLAYQEIDGNENLVCITIAKWESEAYLNKAKVLVKDEYLKIGFNSTEMFERLGITMDRGIYQELELNKPQE